MYIVTWDNRSKDNQWRIFYGIFDTIINKDESSSQLIQNSI